MWDKSRLGVSGDARRAHAARRRAARGPLRAARRHRRRTPASPSRPTCCFPATSRSWPTGSRPCWRNPPERDAASPPAAPAADLSGHWDVQIEYAAGRPHHALHLRQHGSDIDGTHAGDFVSRDLTGTIDGDSVRLRSSYGEAHGDALNFTFIGKVDRRRDVGHARHGRVPAAARGRRARHDAAARLTLMCALSCVAGLLAWSLAGAASAQAPPKYDLLLRGGHVIDAKNDSAPCATSRSPAARSPRSRERSIPPTPSRRSTSRASTSRLGSSTSTCTSTPAPARRARTPATTASTPTASRSASGVTTVVDAGCSGWRNFEDFKERIIDRSQDARPRLPQHRRQRHARRQVRAGPGRHGGAAGRRDGARSIRASIVGIKTAHYAGPGVDAGRARGRGGHDREHPGDGRLRRRTSPSGRSAELVTKKLRPGDIYTHVLLRAARRARSARAR